MNKHLPYNVLLAVTVVAVALMAICVFALRQPGFDVTVRYDYPAVAVESEQSLSPTQPAGVQPNQPSGVGESPPGIAPEEEQDRVSSVQFPLELNTATQEELMFIPQVGDVLSQRIVQYREVLGGYSSLEQLMEIAGIAEVTYQNIWPYLYLEETLPDDAEAGEEQDDAYLVPDEE